MNSTSKKELSVSERIKETAGLLGLELNEEFNIRFDDDSLSSGSPFKFTEHNLVNKCLMPVNVLIGFLLNGKYKIEKLPWKPRNGHIVWDILTNQRTNDGNFENVPHSFTFKNNNLTHLALYKSGWMFRTKKDAEANLERVVREMREVKEND